MKNTIFLFLFSFTFFGFSQSLKKVEKNSLADLYSSASLNAYFSSSNSKITDFYSLISLYSSKETTSELKYEIKVSLLQLFGNKETQIVDFFNNKSNSLSLNEFLLTIENTNIDFKVSNVKRLDVFNLFGWKTSYDLEVLELKSKKRVNTITLTQTISFEIENKKFGNKTKELRTIYLGKIE